MKKTVPLLWGMILFALVVACGRNVKRSLKAVEIPVYHTWISMNEREYGAPVPPPPEEIPPPGFFPWAGIVSHHLLTHDFLDSWFSRLAEIRPVCCFYILSPAHHGISLELYSLTTGSWESGFGRVDSDIDTVKKLTGLLGVIPDIGAFQFEHGVSTLMPYVKKYFPESRVVVIAYESESPVNIPVNSRLADVLENEFDEKGKKENFLLISADFSHRCGLEETARRDTYSKRYLKNSPDTFWNMVACDNSPGIYVLDRLGKNNLESYIFYHTNSWEIAGQWEDNVTSYFFVYFGE